MKLLVAGIVGAAAVLGGGVSFSRTVKAINGAQGSVIFDKGCSSKDDYGSNDCSWSWGDSIGIDYSVALQEDITSGTIALDLKVDNIIPFNANCPACGANCTVTVPIVKKTITFALPPCPIKAASFKNSTQFTLPAKNPLGLGVNVKGSATITDQNNKQVIALDITAAVS
jgi:hypothetical protein